MHYLLSGNRDIKADVLKSIIHGKNVQYVDKVIINVSIFRPLSTG